MRVIIPTSLAALLLVGCATGPGISTTDTDQSITPRDAVAEIDVLRGNKVLWGGMIVNSTNFEDSTRLEVLAYPLDGAQRPDTDAQPHGRFLVVKPGYLETVDYSQGRLITVKGTITKARKGKINEANYIYPVIASNRLYLWPQQDTAENRGRWGVNFGFGIGVVF